MGRPVQSQRSRVLDTAPEDRAKRLIAYSTFKAAERPSLHFVWARLMKIYREDRVMMLVQKSNCLIGSESVFSNFRQHHSRNYSDSRFRAKCCVSDEISKASDLDVGDCLAFGMPHATVPVRF